MHASLVAVIAVSSLLSLPFRGAGSFGPFRNPVKFTMMRRLHPYKRFLVTAFTVWFVVGCRSTHILEEPPICEPPATRQIETANVCVPILDAADDLPPPLTVNTQEAPEDWFLSLEEVVRITLANSDVIRDIGGRLVTGAAGVASIYDVAQQELAVEQALSAFDTQLNSSIFFNRNERAFNNQIFGGGATSVSSNTANHNVEFSKSAATGTQYLVRSISSYERNSLPADFNEFRSFYNTALEAEVRQPLLRGRGIGFNRIAGPNGNVGNYNGVVIARIRTDIALADFESSVRDLVRDVESAYWRLYFAYRQLDARTAAYEASLASWRTVQDQFEAGTADGEQEALARTAYYQAKVAMRNALAGGSNNVVGVHSQERNLRKLMGIPANDGRLIRPADEPSVAKRIFDWQDSLDLALGRRVELRRQRWVVKQRQNELLASKNYLLSQLDFVGLYRWRGFGNDLFGNGEIPNGSAFGDLMTGDLEGWQLGLQYSVPLGKRREHAFVRAAELNLARERSVLRNQELFVGNDLSSQFAEMERTYEISRDNFNRTVAERQRLEYAQAKYEAGQELLEFVLQAQQTTADADSQYYSALVDYNVAVANMHYQRGTYLDFMGVRLSEGAWSPESHRSYAKEFRRFRPSKINYCKMEPGPVSRGTYSQVAPMTSETAIIGSQSNPSMISSGAELLGAGDLQRLPTEGLDESLEAPLAPEPVLNPGNIYTGGNNSQLVPQQLVPPRADPGAGSRAAVPVSPPPHVKALRPAYPQRSAEMQGIVGPF